MPEFQIGPYRLSADAEGTGDYYAARPLPWVTCACAGCRNFALAVRTLPPAVTDFFAALGLDPEKPAEVCVDPAFSPECHLLPEDFPQPGLQLNLEWRLPWLLEEENPYG